MSLAQMQTALARILTDAEVRDRFFSESDAALADLDLSPGERASLAELDKKRIAIHAHIVMSARLERALRGLHLVQRVIQADLERLAADFCARYPPQAAGARTESEMPLAIAFLLEEQAASRPWPDYFEDLVRYEEHLLRVGGLVAPWAVCPRPRKTEACTPGPACAERFAPRLRGEAEVVSFGCDVGALVRRLASGRVPQRAPKRPTTLLLCREPKGVGVRSYRLSEALRRLIALCDGTMPVAAVLSAFAEERGRDVIERLRLSEAALQTMQTLCDAGAVELVPVTGA